MDPDSSQHDQAAPQVTALTQELEHLSRFRELGMRHAQVMFRSKDVWAEETSVTELKAVLAEWEDLLNSLPKEYLFLNPDHVRTNIATAKSQIAQCYSAQRNSEEALRYYHLARQDYEELGAKEKVQECWESIGQVRLWEEGIIDDELQRRQAQLDTLPRDSLNYIEGLITLSELYARARDDFETEKVLLAAEKALRSLQLVDDRGHYLSDLVIQGISERDKITSDPETYQRYALFVQTYLFLLQERLYSGLAAVYGARDFEKALHYLQMAQQKAGDGRNARFLELQLAFIVLRQGIKALTTGGHEQDSNVLAENLLQGARASEVQSRSLNVLEGVITALLLQADIFLATQRDDEAIAVLTNAGNELKARLFHDMGVRVLAKLAEAHVHKQQWREASAVCNEGIALVEQYRYKVTSQYMQSAYLTSRIGLYACGVRAAYELKDYPLMLQRAELSKCRSVLRYQQRRIPTLTEEQQLQLTERSFQQVSEQIADASPDSALYNELQHKRGTLWDLLTVQRFQARAGEHLLEFSLEVVQVTLAADEAIVYYYWLDTYTLLITVIDRQQVVPVLRTVSREEQARLKEFADFVLASSGNSVSYLDTIKNFSALLLPEEAKTLLEAKQRLLFSPHRLLHTLPFHALQWEHGFLIQRFAVTYVPNLSSMLLRYAPARQQHLLALGVREYVVPGQTLRPLKTAEQEVDDLQQLCAAHSVPIVALKGAEVRRERLQQLDTTSELGKLSCLHFATHGANINSDTPMESHLFLRDAKLDGLEIANWQLNADLVVLSACCSGQRPISGRWMEELPGDELFGLQSAFFTAGARRILSCLWPVKDAIASRMSKTFHQHLMSGEPPEMALQSAIKEYLETADFDEVYVAYWAPFFLSAMGRPDLANAEEEER